MSNISNENLNKIKLVNVIRKLGLSYLDSIDIIRIDDHVQNACWIYNQANHTEEILINRHIVEEKSELTIEMLLRHEILHRAFYNGFNYKFDDKKRANIVLDISINKLLKIAYQEKSDPLFKLYTAPCYECELILCIADVEKEAIQDIKLRKIYSDIWDNTEMPNPESIYYQLMELEHRKKKNENSRGVKESFRSNDNPFRIPDTSQRKFGITYRDMKITKEREVLDQKGINNKTLEDNISRDVKIKTSHYGSSSFFEEFRVDVKPMNTDPLMEFVKEIRHIRQLSKITQDLRNTLEEKDQLMVYPLFLNRIGIIYNAMGVNDAIPLYWNKSEDYIKGNKHQIALYIDTSASMWNYIGYISWIIKQFDDFKFSSGDRNEECYGFDIRVYPLSIKSISQGDFIGRGGTDFDAPLEHFLQLEDGSDVALIFTDGFSDIDEDLVRHFQNRHDKRVYAIYFSERGEDEVYSPLNEIAERHFTLYIDRENR